MIRSIPMFDPKTNRRVVIEATAEMLEKICEEVSGNSLAMSALYQGYQSISVSLLRGDISSPAPPDDYLVLYQIMNSFDPRLAGALGPQIIRHLERELIEKKS